jgi:hypothetical protein
MPIILPPTFAVPAIIRVASHTPGGSAATHSIPPATRSTTAPANPGPQPLDAIQTPQIVTPPAAQVSPPPPLTTTTTSGWKR